MSSKQQGNDATTPVLSESSKPKYMRSSDSTTTEEKQPVMTSISATSSDNVEPMTMSGASFNEKPTADGIPKSDDATSGTGLMGILRNLGWPTRGKLTRPNQTQTQTQTKPDKPRRG